MFDTTDADTRADGAKVGAILYDAVNDRLGVINGDQELLVHDQDVLDQLQSGVTVTATDLDIRDPVFATDKVDVTGSEVSLDAATLAALETVTVLQGTDPWIIGDGGGSITVDAVDLDIRDLSAAQDSVQAWAHDGAGTAITSTTFDADQALEVNVVGGIAVDAQITVADNAPVTLPEYEDYLYRLRVTRPVQLFQGQWGFNGQPLVWSSQSTGGATLDEPDTTGHNFIKFNTTSASGRRAARSGYHA